MPFDFSINGGGGGNGPTNDDAVNVLYFLRQCEIEAEMWQGIRAADAFESACKFVGVDPVEARAAMSIKHEEG